MFPFPRWINFFPFLGCGAHCHELLEEGQGKWDIADEMGRLAGVIGNDLDRVLKGSKIRFGRIVEDGQSLGCGENRMELLASGC